MCSDAMLRDSALSRISPRTGKISVLADFITCLDLFNFFTAVDEMPALGHFQRLPCPLKSEYSKPLNTQIWAAAQGGIQQLFSFSVRPNASQHHQQKVLGWRTHPRERSCSMVISPGMDNLATGDQALNGTRRAAPLVGYQQLSHFYFLLSLFVCHTS